MDLKRNFLRLLAVGALAAATVVVIVVVADSWPSSDGDGRGRGARAQQEAEEGSGDKYYFVQPGDSLSTIAEKEGVDLETLEQLNPTLDPQALTAGERVRLR